MNKATTGVCAALPAASTLTLAGCQTSSTALSDGPLPSMVQAISDRAESQGKPALIVVSALDWCPACQTYHRETLDTPETQRALEDVVVYEHIDYDTNKAVAKELGVSSFPTTILIVDGKKKASFTAPRSRDELLAWIEKNSG